MWLFGVVALAALFLLEKRDRLSKHFTLEQLTASQTAKERRIPNDPNPAQIENLRSMAAHTLEPLFSLIGPFQLTSGFRSVQLNQAVGGVSNSKHLLGKAVDLRSDRYPPAEIVLLIQQTGIPYDELIAYSGHVHLAVNGSGYSGSGRSGGRSF